MIWFMIHPQWAVAQIENNKDISDGRRMGFFDGLHDAQTRKTASCNNGNESEYCIGYCQGQRSLAIERAKGDPGIIAGGYGCEQ
jgi:hypothetical protein